MSLCRVLPHFAQLSYKIPILLHLKANYTVDMTKKTAILLIADGSEEMEAVITTDVLRRAGVIFLLHITLNYIFILYINIKYTNILLNMELKYEN